MACLLIRRILCLLLFSLSYATLEAVPVQRFQPLKDTLNEYGILKVPEASDYPDVPAVALLSLQQITVYGKAITVWRKEPSGIWKCVIDIWKEDPPAERTS